MTCCHRVGETAPLAPSSLHLSPLMLGSHRLVLLAEHHTRTCRSRPFDILKIWSRNSSRPVTWCTKKIVTKPSQLHRTHLCLTIMYLTETSGWRITVQPTNTQAPPALLQTHALPQLLYITDTTFNFSPPQIPSFSCCRHQTTLRIHQTATFNLLPLPIVWYMVSVSYRKTGDGHDSGNSLWHSVKENIYPLTSADGWTFR